MKRGLLIGKFMPIHQGHIALINFAASQCDELIISMSFTDDDPIPADVRFGWITEIFKERQSIKPAMVKDNFDNEALPLPERTKLWSNFIQKRYPSIDCVFSSEDYGEPFAEWLGARNILFDKARVQFPVSASRIRDAPFRFWNFIPPQVRPFFVKKVCIYGAESTGKSTITKFLAAKYQTEYVPEVARELITTNDFTVDDIIKIGIAHDQRIQEKSRIANKLLFCDTDVITTQIYSHHYLGVVPDILFELERKTSYARYFMMDIDVAWVPDGLRDLGDQRQAMMDVFKSELDKRNIDYTFVNGSYAEREALICREVDKLL